MTNYYIELNSHFHPLTMDSLESLKGVFVEPLNRENLKVRSTLVLARLDREGKLLTVEPQVYPKQTLEGAILPKVYTASVVGANHIEVYQCPIYFSGSGLPIITNRQTSRYWQNTRLLNLKRDCEQELISGALQESGV